MGGTLLNALTVLIGSVLGMVIGDRFPSRMRETIVTGLGLVTLIVGISNGQSSGNIVIPLFSITIGGLLGEWLRIDAALDRLAGWLQRRVGGATDGDAHERSTTDSARQRFITGFVTASLLFCVGPLTILGSIQDGMGLPIGFEQLLIKSVLDGFAALALAASFGLGVVFTVLTVLIVQGGLALIGSFAGQFMSEIMVTEMTATGGLILIGLALILLDVKRPRVANLLPALLVAPLIVAAAAAFGIDIYPFS
ncbi:MAG: DUF554 domain-containing protein [Chloroflexi bacterium]|nr:MAG: putative membrane protein YdfK [Chloroflexi bacterium OLB13]MBC6956770.1 DUF554 domain-containing protein [Chloroflexota bacterium]MBV6435011.1 putative membrane protein YdfK [Anaerolineae bacterium]MDL1914764.1 DUF554 domain-containing protein [Anaerolineae bacterium CFX4]MBW7877901.1 DUF554 domain-containing protein [Anaerolineae bacterium]